MPQQAPPVAVLAERLLVDIEQAVRTFPRYHKYAIGARLRELAWKATEASHRAWRDQARRGTWLRRLVFAVDDLKLCLQTCQRVQAFRSFGQFEAVARLAADLGRQCGGWQRQFTQGQNRRAETPAGRAQILSSRGTPPAGVNP